MAQSHARLALVTRNPAVYFQALARQPGELRGIEIGQILRMDQQFQPALQPEAQAVTVRADGLDPPGDALKADRGGFDPAGLQGRTAPEAALG